MLPDGTHKKSIINTRHNTSKAKSLPKLSSFNILQEAYPMLSSQDLTDFCQSMAGSHGSDLDLLLSQDEENNSYEQERWSTLPSMDDSLSVSTMNSPRFEDDSPPVISSEWVESIFPSGSEMASFMMDISSTV